jgi:hypothetical protein
VSNGSYVTATKILLVMPASFVSAARHGPAASALSPLAARRPDCSQCGSSLLRRLTFAQNQRSGTIDQRAPLNPVDSASGIDQSQICRVQNRPLLHVADPRKRRRPATDANGHASSFRPDGSTGARSPAYATPLRWHPRWCRQGQISRNVQSGFAGAASRCRIDAASERSGAAVPAAQPARAPHNTMAQTRDGIGAGELEWLRDSTARNTTITLRRP